MSLHTLESNRPMSDRLEPVCTRYVTDIGGSSVGCRPAYPHIDRASGGQYKPPSLGCTAFFRVSAKVPAPHVGKTWSHSHVRSRAPALMSRIGQTAVYVRSSRGPTTFVFSSGSYAALSQLLLTARQVLYTVAALLGLIHVPALPIVVFFAQPS